MHSSSLQSTYKFTQALCRVVDVASYELQLSEERHKHLRDALSTGQIRSKLRALEIISPYPVNRAIFIGHWHGMLPRLLYDFGIIKQAIGIELDGFWSNFSQRVNWDWDFTSVVGDACQVLSDYCHDVQLVVNTSCEHMTWQWLDHIPDHANILIQATDMPALDHINTIVKFADLQSIGTRLNRVLLESDILPLHATYSRYTVLLGNKNHDK